ncbi:MAG: type I-D CRISPR-associated protein Cas5/Csc1 [Methanocellales archaeon]|nr:type I-D CRISPR-associated protein Cas5/Csc1 [Methanocellales archaeon]
MIDRVYSATLILHEDLLFATREMGRVVETGQYIHNYALTYAFRYAKSPIRVTGKDASIQTPQEMVEKYKKDLAPIKDVYVTPAKPLKTYLLFVSYSAREEMIRTTREREALTRKNIPEFGVWLTVAPRSSFECFILAKKPLEERELLPYIRLGKTATKTEVCYEECEFREVKIKKPPLSVYFPLNPMDLPIEALDYELESMRPWPLYVRSSFDAERAIRIDRKGGEPVFLPLGLRYYAGKSHA